MAPKARERFGEKKNMEVNNSIQVQIVQEVNFKNVLWGRKCIQHICWMYTSFLFTRKVHMTSLNYSKQATKISKTMWNSWIFYPTVKAFSCPENPSLEYLLYKYLMDFWKFPSMTSS